MRNKTISIILIGIFLSASILVTPAQENSSGEANSVTYEDNNVYLGEVWTVYDPEVFTGSSNADVVNMTVNWVVPPSDDTAHGTLGLKMYDFNFKENKSITILPIPLETTTICDYEFIVYDGPTPDSPTLTSGHNSFMGAGLKYEDISQPLDVETMGEASRTLAFQLNAKIQTYIPALRTSFETETGSISKIGHMVINFIKPPVEQQPLQDEKLISIDRRYDINLGSIEVYTSDKPFYIPRCDIDINKFNEPFHINKSEKVDVNAYLDYELSIMEKVHPPVLRFLPCQILITVRAMSTDTEGKLREICPPKIYKEILLRPTVEKNGTIQLSFTVDTSKYPSDVEFLVYYFLTTLPLGTQVPSLRSANSARTSIHWGVV